MQHRPGLWQKTKTQTLILTPPLGLCLEAQVWEGMGMYLSERRHEEREETMKRIGQKTCFFKRSRGRETWRTSIRALRPVLVCVPEVPPTGRHARRARRRLDAAQGALRGSKRRRGEKWQKCAGEGERLTIDLSWTTTQIEFFCAVFCGRSPSSCVLRADVPVTPSRTPNAVRN